MRSERLQLQVQDIENERMVDHIRKDKGSKDRDVPLCPRLLETLREHWPWKSQRHGSSPKALVLECTRRLKPPDLERFVLHLDARHQARELGVPAQAFEVRIELEKRPASEAGLDASFEPGHRFDGLS
jgi:integrase